MDLDLKKLRSFVSVAEQLSFIQAAESLHITQPALTRQIQALERELHVTLLTRDRRGVALTGPGRQLLDDARTLLDSATGVERRVRAAARDVREFVVGFMPGVLTGEIIHEFQLSVPQIIVDAVVVPMDEQEPYLHDGRVDVCFLRLPQRSRAVRIIPLFEEPRVAVIPHGSRTRQPAVSIDATATLNELRPLPLIDNPTTLPSWRGDTMPRRRPLINIDERIQAVAAGAGFTVLPAGIATYHHRDDVRIVELTDVPPITVALGYLKHRTMPEIQQFADITRLHLAPETKPEPADRSRSSIST